MIGSAGVWLGSTNNGVGHYGDGTVNIGGGSVAAIESFASDGDVIGIAVDTDADLIWFRKNAGNWNNNGAANPATGANGISIAALGNVALFAAVEGEANGNVWTANFGATAYAHTPPSGFGNW